MSVSGGGGSLFYSAAQIFYCVHSQLLLVSRDPSCCPRCASALCANLVIRPNRKSDGTYRTDRGNSYRFMQPIFDFSFDFLVGLNGSVRPGDSILCKRYLDLGNELGELGFLLGGLPNECATNLILKIGFPKLIAVV